MKTYKQLQEVMSMSDMNKIKGGTEEQRRIAQERQRRRDEERAKKDKAATSVVNPTKRDGALAGGALALRDKKKKFGPADKGGALVRKKAETTGAGTAPKKPNPKAAGVSDERQAGNRPGTSRGKTEAKPKPEEKEEKCAIYQKRDASGKCVNRKFPDLKNTRDVESIEGQKLNY